MKAIVKQKRLPRKLKKKIIKFWGRNTYQGILKGYIVIAPYVLKESIILVNGEELKKPIFTRYAKKFIDNKYYGELK